MKIEYYEDMLEQEAINKYLNMIANDYGGELAKIFQEKYINKEKEIERLQDMDKILRNENINLKLRINKAIEELENIPINANGGDILESERNVYHILKGSDKE